MLIRIRVLGENLNCKNSLHRCSQIFGYRDSRKIATTTNLKNKDPYSVLGVGRDASQDQIKTAYREMIKKYHPDLNPKNAAKFKEIRNAFDTINNKKGADSYSQYSSTSSPYSSYTNQQNSTSSNYNQYTNRSTSGNGTYSKTSNNSYNYYYTGPNTSQTKSNYSYHQWSDFEKSVNDIFNSMKKRQTQNSYQNYAANRSKTDYKRFLVKLTFAEACTGCNKIIKVKTLCKTCKGSGDISSAPVPCSQCFGKGFVNVSNLSSFIGVTCPTCNGARFFQTASPCYSCSGSGVSNIEESVTVSIPSGVTDKQILQLTYDGLVYEIELSVAKSSTFRVEGNDVYSDVTVDYLQALLGTSISVPTLHGNTTINIPKGTPSHHTITLHGKGVKNGNHYVTIKIKIPKETSNEVNKIINDLAKKRGFDINNDGSVKNSTNPTQTYKEVFERINDQINDFKATASFHVRNFFKKNSTYVVILLLIVLFLI